MEIYVVRRGETVYSVARRYGVSVQRLISDNGLDRYGRLVPGQALLILIPAVTHTVRRGETLYSIAEDYGTTVSALLRNNPWLTNEPSLETGRIITVRFTVSPSRSARINGYIYPYISQQLLKRTLPFLSTVSVFGYGFTDSGALLPPDDDAVLKIVKQTPAAPILVLSSITENGNFSSERAGRLFNSAVLQDAVLNGLVDVMRKKGYKGLDIDFEFVLPEDAAAFLGFITSAARIMHENGFFVNADLAPKSSDEQRGLLYEAHDYAAIGAVADTVLIMTYEWGYTYGPPMAVAPIKPVTQVADFALSRIPAEKVMLGIPNYGYDWMLPFEKGITRAESIGNEYAVTLALNNGADIDYDNLSEAPWFNYTRQNKEHVVWFEDARSIKRKLSLMRDTAMRGLGYWNLMRPFAQNWGLLSAEVIPETVE